jgi:GrpB-like predicted nucleotidyltransferase (UPF0157 family)
MPLTPADIMRTYPFDDSSVERIAHRKIPLKFEIVEPKPEWPQQFAETKTRIQTALGATALSINHYGSTSVPNLPAKDVIDIDLVVPSPSTEAAYVPQLEAIGFRFLLREAAWHEHRFFVHEGEGEAPGYGSWKVNLHVFGPECLEVEKHRVFKEWLCKTPEDVALYAKVKREAAKASEEAGENMNEYTERKGDVIKGILERAWRNLGWIE